MSCSAARRVFLKRRSNLSTTCRNRPMLIFNCRSSKSFRCSSASVVSDRPWITSLMKLSTSGVTLLMRQRLAPGCLSILPVLARAAEILNTQPTLTLNRSASSSNIPCQRHAPPRPYVSDRLNRLSPYEFARILGQSIYIISENALKLPSVSTDRMGSRSREE